MHRILTLSVVCQDFIPPLIFPSRLKPVVGQRSNSLKWRSPEGLPANTIARRSPRAIGCLLLVIAPFVCQIASSTPLVSSAHAQTAKRAEATDRLAKFIEEAAARFAFPARWIGAVMRVESGGDEHAVSSRGAMGLMQLMPGTWVDLSVRYGLGVDPFDVHDNIIAGTAYLKDLHTRFGSAGFLAAYHAGPARYERHLATGRPLPQETIAYVAAVTTLLGQEQIEPTPTRTKHAVPWREAPLFVERTGAP